MAFASERASEPGRALRFRNRVKAEITMAYAPCAAQRSAETIAKISKTVVGLWSTEGSNPSPSVIEAVAFYE
jgi:hypothetical protein